MSGNSAPAAFFLGMIAVPLIIAVSATGPASALGAPPSEPAGRWTAQRARAWGERRGWIVGCNFIPSTAINELEMWQADTFDPATIDRELGWAQSLGFNSVRVFLHNIPWDEDSKGYTKRIEKFLAIADLHHIHATFVLFDSCWNPYPKPGKQPAPKQGLHNSGWVQCPGAELLEHPERWGKLEAYVRGVVGHFKDDPRIDMWDVYNEPDNTNDSSYGKDNLKVEIPDKVGRTLPLLEKAFDWARAAGPMQPLTSAPWQGDWSSDSALSKTARVQFDRSDVISFHMYAGAAETARRIAMLRRYNRPLVCTEYMARPIGSTFAAILPYLHEQHVGAYNWGFVAGKTNTIYPWDSWQHPYSAQPTIWFHDIFWPNGKPYDPAEVKLIREVTAAEATTH